MPSSKSQQTVSPSRPLTVQIPTGLDAAMSANANGPPSKESATEADIKFGERTAFIPMTCQEQQVLDRLEAGLQAAAGLWRDFQQQQEHDRLLSSALHHWRAATGAGGIDTSWVWEVGRWNTQFSLPLALELRRLDPNAMADSDHLLAQSTCLRNRQIELAKKLATASAAAATTTGNTGGSGKKKATPPASLEDLEDEPCLCQIRWGLAPDTEAAKRRQLEKLDEDHSVPVQQPQPQPKKPHQPPHHHHHHHHQQQQQQQLGQHPHPHPHNPPSSAGPRRPIVKTSHLRGLAEQEPVYGSEDAGYASQNCSPGSRGASSFINDLLAVSASGGRSWAD